MQPTFNPSHSLSSNPLHHDVVLLDRWSVNLHQYQRGDVVTLWSPQNPRLLTTKRIIGLEGDLITPVGAGSDSSSRKGKDAEHGPSSASSPVRIPPGHCWVEGDSHKASRDSNAYGPVSQRIRRNE